MACKYLPFSFEAKWLLYDSIMTLVHSTYVKSSCALQLAKKIEILKRKSNNGKSSVITILR